MCQVPQLFHLLRAIYYVYTTHAETLANGAARVGLSELGRVGGTELVIHPALSVPMKLYGQ